MTFLAAPLDHIAPTHRDVLLWQDVFSQRSDFPAIEGRGNTVCVVGGGIAGLVAAYELSRRGFAVTLVESARSCGGRVKTHYFENGSYGEFGAMRIPTVHRAVMDYVQEFSLPTRHFVNFNPYGRFLLKGVHGTLNLTPLEVGQEWRTEPQYEHLTRALPGLSVLSTPNLNDGPEQLVMEVLVHPILHALREAGGLADLLRDEAREPMASKLRSTLLSEFIHEDIVGMTSDDWSYLSRACGVASFEHCTAHQFLMDMVTALLSQSMVEIVGGMQLLPNAYLQRLTAAAVLLETRVESIDVQQGGVRIGWTGGDGGATFDFVVVAVPPDSLGTIQIVGPEEVRHRWDAVSSIPMGQLAKSLLTFTERFWELQNPPVAGGLSFSDLPSQQCWYPSDNAHRFRDAAGCIRFLPTDEYTSRGIGAMTAAHRRGDEAVAFSAKSPDELTSQAVRDLAQLHCLPDNYLWDRLDGAAHQYWHAAYAISDPSSMRAAALGSRASDGIGRLVFAGEHLSPMHGWMVSAVVSALSAVKQVLESAGRIANAW